MKQTKIANNKAYALPPPNKTNELSRTKTYLLFKQNFKLLNCFFTPIFCEIDKLIVGYRVQTKSAHFQCVHCCRRPFLTFSFCLCGVRVVCCLWQRRLHFTNIRCQCGADGDILYITTNQLLHGSQIAFLWGRWNYAGRLNYWGSISVGRTIFFQRTINVDKERHTSGNKHFITKIS